MSEVMALRTQILGNLKMLGCYGLRDRRDFVLIWNGEREYTVFFDHLDPFGRHEFRDDDYHGKGATIEEAYTNMLKQTARELYRCYHKKDSFGPISH
ncbi:hypothetical protein KCU73_g11265, partial [Aureobasidium melanogenum]